MADQLSSPPVGLEEVCEQHFGLVAPDLLKRTARTWPLPSRRRTGLASRRGGAGRARFTTAGEAPQEQRVRLARPLLPLYLCSMKRRHCAARASADLTPPARGS